MTPRRDNPREPHGFREPNHHMDKIERELVWQEDLDWFDEHLFAF